MAAHVSDPNAPTEADRARLHAWCGDLLAGAEGLPIRYVHRNRPVRGIPAAWTPTVQRRRIDATAAEIVFEGADPDGGLRVRVEATTWFDYPVVEWVAWFTNPGPEPGGILEQVDALEAEFIGAEAALTYCNGDFNSELGYEPRVSPLPDGASLELAPTGGRPCDSAFPYVRLGFADAGLTLAIGWPGQWSADFRGGGQGVRARAGQQTVHVRLRPGEWLRTPRITVLAWDGAEERGINLWRRWYRAHVLPRSAAGPMRPHLSAATTDDGEEFTAATEKNQIRYIDRFGASGVGPDVWWIDAGWYPCADASGRRDWRRTGSWEADPDRFPRELGPVAAAAAGIGADQLLWFEPERVAPGTRLDREHPQWLLKAQTGTPATPTQATSALLNLGDPEARAWLTDHVSDFIQRNRIGVYRQDFNFRPLPFWEANDELDRQGMTENLHVQGYLRFWDELLERNPGIWIDSCASGGRRNDLETMRRSVPLHYTDYGYGYHRIKLAFHHTLFEWLPYFKEASLSWTERDAEGHHGDEPPDSFGFHCSLAPMLSLALDIRSEENDLGLFRRMCDIWRRAAPRLLEGDYYPITPFSKSASEWVAWQFDQPRSGEGLVQAIRHRDAPAERLHLPLRGLARNRVYRLENPETGEEREVAGAELLDGGLTVELPARSGSLWLYSVV